jgi:hypothetical protein
MHSFTRTSLQRAAARHGYAVVDDRHTDSKQLVRGRSAVGPVRSNAKGTPNRDRSRSDRCLAVILPATSRRFEIQFNGPVSLFSK